MAVKSLAWKSIKSGVDALMSLAASPAAVNPGAEETVPEGAQGLPGHPIKPVTSHSKCSHGYFVFSALLAEDPLYTLGGTA